MQPWRAPQPPDDFNLTVDDLPAGSGLTIGYSMELGEIMVVLSGWFMVLLGVAAGLQLVWEEHYLRAVLAPILFLSCGWALLQTGAKTIGILLQEDRCLFIIRYGFLLDRGKVILSDPKMKITGTKPRFMGLEVVQEKVFYHVIVKTLRTKRFILACDEREGDWIVARLNEWLDYCLSEKAPVVYH